jgi:hypothetical protein
MFTSAAAVGEVEMKKKGVMSDIPYLLIRHRLMIVGWPAGVPLPTAGWKIRSQPFTQDKLLALTDAMLTVPEKKRMKIVPWWEGTFVTTLHKLLYLTFCR